MSLVTGASSREAPLDWLVNSRVFHKLSFKKIAIKVSEIAEVVSKKHQMDALEAYLITDIEMRCASELARSEKMERATKRVFSEAALGRCRQEIELVTYALENRNIHELAQIYLTESEYRDLLLETLRASYLPAFSKTPCS